MVTTNTFSASNAVIAIKDDGSKSRVRRQLVGLSLSAKVGLQEVRLRFWLGSVVEVEAVSGRGTAGRLLAASWFHTLSFFSHSTAFGPKASLAGVVKLNLSMECNALQLFLEDCMSRVEALQGSCIK